MFFTRSPEIRCRIIYCGCFCGGQNRNSAIFVRKAEFPENRIQYLGLANINYPDIVFSTEKDDGTRRISSLGYNGLRLVLSTFPEVLDTGSIRNGV